LTRVLFDLTQRDYFWSCWKEKVEKFSILGQIFQTQTKDGWPDPAWPELEKIDSTQVKNILTGPITSLSPWPSYPKPNHISIRPSIFQDIIMPFGLNPEGDDPDLWFWVLVEPGINKLLRSYFLNRHSTTKLLDQSLTLLFFVLQFFMKGCKGCFLQHKFSLEPLKIEVSRFWAFISLLPLKAPLIVPKERIWKQKESISEERL